MYNGQYAYDATMPMYGGQYGHDATSSMYSGQYGYDAAAPMQSGQYGYDPTIPAHDGQYGHDPTMSTHGGQYEKNATIPMPSTQLAVAPSSFCMECGNPLQPGLSFCMECGTRAGAAGGDSVGGGAPSSQYSGSQYASASYPGAAYPYPMQNQSGNSGGVLMMGILLMVTAIIFLAGVILFTQNGEKSEVDLPITSSADQPQEEETEDSVFDEESAPVELTSTYTTDSQAKRPNAYPVFKFKYADGWKIVDGDIDQRYELFSVQDKSFREINYILIDDFYNQPYTIRVRNVEKVADSALSFNDGGDPSWKQDYAVVRFDIQKSDSSLLASDSSVIALLPEDVVDDPTLIDFSTGLPSFKHGYNISFFMVYDDEDILEQRYNEAVATLASLEFVKEVPASDISELNSSNPYSYMDDYGYDSGYYSGNGDYIIPDSHILYLTEDDLVGLSEYELYLARNEIYARHGRKFQNDDLNSYFNSKSWYYPTIEPDDFSDSMLSQIERDNLQTILSQERSMGSPYL